MYNPHLARFVNGERPQLHHLSVTSVPIELGQDDASDFLASFDVDPSDDIKCAAVGRLWESLLEKYPGLPFLMLRVADMRWALNSKVTAYAMYLDLQRVLKDSAFSAWLQKARVKVLTDAVNTLRAYKTNTSIYTPSLCWRPNVAQDTLPASSCKLQHAEYNAFEQSWTRLSSTSSDALLTYINYHCLETNAIEGVLQYNPPATVKLAKEGFFTQTEVPDRCLTSAGVVRDHVQAIAILQDTRKAMDEINKLFEDPSFELTLETVCHLHKTLMRTNHILAVRQHGTGDLAHTHVGVTRQHCAINVSVAAKDVKVQFCPFDSVDAELTAFCSRFNELLRQQEVDPFAAAAWISHVFVTIHPFEDGNGRLSRLLASVPLLRQRLPPLTVAVPWQSKYYHALNWTRANGDGDYGVLMKTLFQATQSAMDELYALLTSRVTEFEETVA
ncbi:fido domain-containing protein [Trametes elegans]|nr:fido domain-containing protein [Trametes elegans]